MPVQTPTKRDMSHVWAGRTRAAEKRREEKVVAEAEAVLRARGYTVLPPGEPAA